MTKDELIALKAGMADNEPLKQIIDHLISKEENGQSNDTKSSTDTEGNGNENSSDS